MRSALWPFLHVLAVPTGEKKASPCVGSFRIDYITCTATITQACLHLPATYPSKCSLTGKVMCTLSKRVRCAKAGSQRQGGTTASGCYSIEEAYSG